MYSILPALVASVFLGYGLYVVCTQGFTRIGISFSALCIISAFWQGTWAVLFQVHTPGLAMFLIKFGYLLILFLPTSLYHFLTEVSDSPKERHLVYLSYGIASILAVFLVTSDLFVAGFYEYFWGYYPRAGLLHPIHVLQTVVVVNRGLYITFRQQKIAPPNKRIRLRLCIAGLLTYFFAAIDYLCNYGFEFYPPGVLFIAVSLGIITVAIVKYGLFNPMAIAASVAHEMRTPLLSIRNQAQGINKYIPTLLHSYDLAVANNLCEPTLPPFALNYLATIGKTLTHEVDRTSAVLDMMLASIKMDQIDKASFAQHDIGLCLAEAIDRYTYDRQDREHIVVSATEEFRFYGSDTLLILVFFNLLKNALYAIKIAGKGEISISTARGKNVNRLYFRDTGTGIAGDALPNIFDGFFTTKEGDGTGVGLTFCHRVMASFGGRILCDSVAGQYTTFTLEFPVLPNASDVSPAASKLQQAEEDAAVPPPRRL
ncbi:sensor histidine kinase [Collimonas sp.]|jgi:two-component system CAI-1 autoinducer sensor kinase/phosphatase CqsS|uniref:sensor histidine kinase n=1 Tax=Collimonas sp. TaxID=1963772 RepID=UPI002B9C5D10|nr:ATP-binding protein [Collimonas sp.]HWW04691.1 ATP-binding protein [Collimonas sp.]